MCVQALACFAGSGYVLWAGTSVLANPGLLILHNGIQRTTPTTFVFMKNNQVQSLKVVLIGDGLNGYPNPTWPALRKIYFSEKKKF